MSFSIIPNVVSGQTIRALGPGECARAAAQMMEEHDISAVLILDDILATGTGYVVCNVETDQKAFIARAGSTHPEVKIRVNMDPGIVACNDPATIHAEVDRILSITADHPNCLMGTGCLPYETPPKNIRLIKDYLA